MNYENIYHIEALFDVKIINDLLHHGWVLLSIGHDIDESTPIHIQGKTEILIGADKDTFEKFNLTNYQSQNNSADQTDTVSPLW